MDKSRRPLLQETATNRILAIYEQYHRPEFIGLDPLVALQRFSRSEDLEVAGLIAAVLSYGRVETIIRNVECLFDLMENQPAEFIGATSFAEKKRCFKGFRHRFNDGADIALLLQTIGTLIDEYGSIERFFLSLSDNGTENILHALSAFHRSIMAKAKLRCRTLSRNFRFLVSSPVHGGACKRLNMYLRWMVRPNDGIDLGVWNRVPTAHLMMPVDTHVSAVARRLGLTGRKNCDWKMAEEITAGLRTIDPVDPVRFDFSLCRSGMIAVRKVAA